MFDPVSAGLIAGGGSVLGSVIGGLFQKQAQREANASNERIAGENRAFQERMSSSAHQREVADLKAAGLNPILSASRGGASSPPGATATMNPASDSFVGDAISKGLGTAMQIVSFEKDMKQKDAQVDATKAAALASVGQANASQASARATAANMPVIEGHAKSAMTEADSRISQAQAKKAQADWDVKYAPYDAAAKRVLDAVGGVSTAVGVGGLLQLLKNRKHDRIRQDERHIHDQGIHGTELP